MGGAWMKNILWGGRLRNADFGFRSHVGVSYSIAGFHTVAAASGRIPSGRMSLLPCGSLPLKARAAQRLSLRNNHRVWATRLVLGNDFLAKRWRAEKVRGHLVLAYAPELGLQTMTDELTALLNEVLETWDGPVPQLA